ncbi:MAG: pyridoxamine 5'-phosphate oxidase family protein [Candidatus Pacearchaeota archaeon]|nr:pyridoxamine 5'-phosphate oxidase family protein [Candidatus Pacearchaeota archaeon]
MKLNDIKDKIEKSVIALASSDNLGTPHNIAVMFAKVKDDKIIITDNYMKRTIENIKNNPKVSLAFWKSEDGIGIEGKGEYFNSGKNLEFVKSLPENKEHPAKGAIVVSVENIRKL